MMWGYYGPNTAWMGWSMALSALFWIALLGVIVWGITRLVGGRNRSTFQTPPPLTAEEILRQRYARGEIDAQTYEAMRERLSESKRSQELSAPPV